MCVREGKLVRCRPADAYLHRVDDRRRATTDEIWRRRLNVYQAGAEGARLDGERSSWEADRQGLDDKVQVSPLGGHTVDADRSEGLLAPTGKQDLTQPV